MNGIQETRSILAWMTRVAALVALLTLPSCDSQDPAIAQIQKAIDRLTIDKTQPDWRTKLVAGPVPEFTKGAKYVWILETNYGEIEIELLPEAAPIHVANTIYLTMLGYYDGLGFHRVVQGFMAQGGCPLGNGQGDPGYKIRHEGKLQYKHNKRGTLSAARTPQPNTAGSQFFLTFVQRPDLDYRTPASPGYTVYGYMINPLAKAFGEIEKRAVIETPQGAAPTEPCNIVSARVEVR